jgi:hypothetical protein
LEESPERCELIEAHGIITKIATIIMSLGLAFQKSTCLWIAHKTPWWLVVVVFQWLSEGDPIPLMSIDIQQKNLVDFLVSFIGLLFISVGFQLESLSSANTIVCKIKVCFGICLLSPASRNLGLALVGLVGFYLEVILSIIEFDLYFEFITMVNEKAPQKYRELEDEEMVEENFTFSHRLSLKVDSHSSTLSFVLQTLTQHRELIGQLQEEANFLRTQGANEINSRF